MDYIPFDPEKHEGRKLFEMQSKEVGDLIATVVVPTDTPFEQAAKTPWYYMVEAEEED